MAYNEKFYYIDEEGNKKKYIGKIIYNNDGTYSGYLTKSNMVVSNKDLEYHEPVEEVNGYYSYYSYTNNQGEMVRYYDSIKRDEDGSPYFTYIVRDLFKLEYVDEVPGKEEYFSYIDPVTKEEKVYSGNIIKKSGKMYGIIKK